MRITLDNPHHLVYTNVVQELGPPLSPFRGWRNTDTQGSGTWWASRDGGSRHHLGRDAISVAGDSALAMLNGTVKRLILAYSGSNLRGVEIHGSGPHEGIYTVQLYLEPVVVVGQTVRMGQIIGACEDVEEYYADLGKPGMTNHLHVAVWRALDPVGLMGAWATKVPVEV